MRTNLATALGYIFLFEGGFAARDTEPGGSVNMGVSQQTLATWRHQHGQPVPTVDDVRALSKDEATAIYEAMYAAPIRFDDLPAGLDLCALDAAVNEGVNWTLRELAKLADVDTGRWPKVAPIVAAVAKWPADSIPSAIDAICNDRLAGKQARPEWTRFGRGWTARIESVRTHAKEMAGAI